jgi:hypothetical protein
MARTSAPHALRNSTIDPAIGGPRRANASITQWSARGDNALGREPVAAGHEGQYPGDVVLEDYGVKHARVVERQEDVDREEDAFGVR